MPAVFFLLLVREGREGRSKKYTPRLWLKLLPEGRRAVQSEYVDMVNLPDICRLAIEGKGDKLLMNPSLLIVLICNTSCELRVTRRYC